MDFKITRDVLRKEFNNACKNIRQANKGLPQKVSINRDYGLISLSHQNWMTMQVYYTDGEGNNLVYNIAL